MHHEILLHVLGDNLYLAPLENPQAILDVGTGTGIWAVEVAEKFPDCEVIGTDIRYVI
jgi:methylase of polypeptide subunit release factors